MTPQPPNPEPKKKKKSLSPILDQIVHGGSSVALNLIKMQTIAGDQALFRSPSLNKTVIFKYPNFDQQIADQPAAPPGGDKPAVADTAAKADRPIETAIYVPHDAAEIGSGGYAIYLRQRDFENLIKHHVGVDMGQISAAYERDVEILRTIDSIPSLDPFLLKSALSKHLSEIHPGYFQISDIEEAGIKTLIAGKVNPIVAKALGLTSATDVNERSARFLQALWDPTMPEAKLFVSAFGISGDQAQQIFEGWKGVSFYEHTFNRNKASTAKLLGWLNSADSIPIDIREFKHYKEQQDMFRLQIIKKLRNIVSNVSSIFGEYTVCHGKFMNDGDPKPFRQFLAGVYRRYWVLGYCSMAVLHASSIFDRFMQGAVQNKLTFEQCDEMLKRMDVSLSSQANVQGGL
ncbi:MAG: hypothetical protein ACKOEE_07480 [Tagaea sp.]|nr:hypothetical protein [Azospirillum sp.]MCA3266509.1 hypothetical protein [Azospirillum sp.]MCZ8124324.1 hypothetical protein [Magnetospirillum sp.]